MVETRSYVDTPRLHVDAKAWSQELHLCIYSTEKQMLS